MKEKSKNLFKIYMVIRIRPILNQNKKINHLLIIQINNLLKLVIYLKVHQKIILSLNFIMRNYLFIKKNLKKLNIKGLRFENTYLVINYPK